jgi:hypothetical protein
MDFPGQADRLSCRNIIELDTVSRNRGGQDLAVRGERELIAFESEFLSSGCGVPQVDLTTAAPGEGLTVG